jgi:hypothetical protein
LFLFCIGHDGRSAERERDIGRLCLDDVIRDLVALSVSAPGVSVCSDSKEVGKEGSIYEEYLVYEWPQMPHGVDEGCSCSCDSLGRVLSFLFGCDQEASRPTGRCCCPGTECLREA